MCAPLAIAVAYRLALAGALHMGRGGAPPLLIPPTSQACRQTAAIATVATVSIKIKHLPAAGLSVCAGYAF